jgi:YbgC/YbaW family acyl-CoA thioester hydrolase
MLSIELPQTVRFEDADPAGVVFYPRALALAHGAVEELIRRSSLGWEAWFAADTHAAPLRRAEADFFLPMKVGLPITLRAAVKKIGTTSVTFVVDFLDQAGHLAARICTVHVLIDKATGHPAPLTREMHRALGD